MPMNASQLNDQHPDVEDEASEDDKENDSQVDGTAVFDDDLNGDSPLMSVSTPSKHGFAFC